MRLRVQHITHYAYASPAFDSHNEARLMPLSDEEQTCLAFRLTTEPVVKIFEYDTPVGRVHHFNLHQPHSILEIRAESEVFTNRINPFRRLQLVTDDRDFYRRDDIRQRYAEFLTSTERVPLVPETERIARVARNQSGVAVASFLITLNRLMHRVFTYSPGATDVNTSILQVLEQEKGVCQDFAHLMLSVLRSEGIPSRYVSGYLHTGHDAATEDEPEQTRVSNEAMHAWVECLLPDETWCGFDPTNNLVVNSHYIKVHHGRDYSDVTPLKGLYRGAIDSKMKIFVRVTREEERLL
ncbi:MAG: transglutaminase family protein [Chthonomonadaceae bacterium]|nr:transglutaminase family protein [Chthonomonadaceae bacterium]